MEPRNVLYSEVQRPKQIWVWISIFTCAAIMWYGFIQQIIYGIPFGSKPASDGLLIIFWVIFGIVFLLFTLGLLKLITEVRNDGLYIRFVPFHFQYRKYLFKDIQHYESITYSPLKQFGGWGISFNLNGETVYNMNGNKGIKLKLKFNTVVVGTEKPDELKKAMDSAQQHDKN